MSSILAHPVRVQRYPDFLLGNHAGVDFLGSYLSVVHNPLQKGGLGLWVPDHPGRQDCHFLSTRLHGFRICTLVDGAGLQKVKQVFLENLRDAGLSLPL